MHIMYHVYTGYNHQEQTLNEKLNLRYCMTLNGIKVKVTSEGHIPVKGIKVYYAHYVSCLYWLQPPRANFE